MDLYHLKALGINSTFEANELERELVVRFDEFTREQQETWIRQTRCLEQYAKTRTYSSAARAAGVTVFTVEAWERDNTLGFVRRKDLADREFCDGLEELILERARQPDAPPSLVNAVIRAHIPEKYKRGRQSDDCDHGDRREPDPTGPPDFYHRLIADILSQIQERDTPPPQHGETPTHAPDPTGLDSEPAPDPTYAPPEPDSKPAPNPSPSSPSGGSIPGLSPSGG